MLKGSWPGPRRAAACSPSAVPCRGASSQDAPWLGTGNGAAHVLSAARKNRCVLCHPSPMAVRLARLRPQTPQTPVQYCFLGRRSRKFKRPWAGQGSAPEAGEGLGRARGTGEGAGLGRGQGPSPPSAASVSPSPVAAGLHLGCSRWLRACPSRTWNGSGRQVREQVSRRLSLARSRLVPSALCQPGSEVPHTSLWLHGCAPWMCGQLAGHRRTGRPPAEPTPALSPPRSTSSVLGTPCPHQSHRRRCPVLSASRTARRAPGRTGHCRSF